MQDIILKYSKYSKSSNFNVTCDVIEYNDKYYCGINLYKNFINYLIDEAEYVVIVYNLLSEAYKHFNAKSF